MATVNVHNSDAALAPSKVDQLQQRLQSDLSDVSDDSSGSVNKDEESNFKDTNIKGENMKRESNLEEDCVEINEEDLVAAKKLVGANNTLDCIQQVDNDRKGIVRVKLSSASPNWDNQAEVEVDCDRPDEVIGHMLQTIVDKFPPTSMVTVEKGLRKEEDPVEQPPAPIEYPIEEVIKNQYKYKTIDVIREVEKLVPKYIPNIVEKIVEVPSKELTPVMRAIPVDTSFVLPKFSDREVPVVVGQSVVPEIEESDDILEVEVCKYIPYLVPVDVYVPLPVSVPISPKGETEQVEIPVNNTDPMILQKVMLDMNPHLQDLDNFNHQQQEVFANLLKQSVEQANAYGFKAPQPIIVPIVRQSSKATERSRLASKRSSGRQTSRTTSAYSQQIQPMETTHIEDSGYTSREQSSIQGDNLENRTNQKSQQYIQYSQNTQQNTTQQLVENTQYIGNNQNTIPQAMMSQLPIQINPKNYAYVNPILSTQYPNTYPSPQPIHNKSMQNNMQYNIQNMQYPSIIQNHNMQNIQNMQHMQHMQNMQQQMHASRQQSIDAQNQFSGTNLINNQDISHRKSSRSSKTSCSHISNNNNTSPVAMA